MMRAGRRELMVLLLLGSLTVADGWAQTYTPTGDTVKSKDRSVVPGFPDVLAEYLQTPGVSTPGTPVGLDMATFLRLRTAADGERPRPANVVLLAMPGFASTPPHWLFLAAQLVHKAAGQTCTTEGRRLPCRLEVWVVQRRGANLADTAGAIEARVAGDLDTRAGAGRKVALRAGREADWPRGCTLESVQAGRSPFYGRLGI
ncbi:MAG: hypothetical protein RIR52_768 [Acidobacteriota bacterium]